MLEHTAVVKTAPVNPLAIHFKKLLADMRLLAPMFDVSDTQIEPQKAYPKWRIVGDEESDFNIRARDPIIGWNWYAIQRAEALLADEPWLISVYLRVAVSVPPSKYLPSTKAEHTLDYLRRATTPQEAPEYNRPSQ